MSLSVDACEPGERLTRDGPAAVADRRAYPTAAGSTSAAAAFMVRARIV